MMYDSDGDGIIQSDLADGKYGIAPVLASEAVQGANSLE